MNVPRLDPSAQDDDSSRAGDDRKYPSCIVLWPSVFGSQLTELPLTRESRVLTTEYGIFVLGLSHNRELPAAARRFHSMGERLWVEQSTLAATAPRDGNWHFISDDDSWTLPSGEHWQAIDDATTWALEEDPGTRPKIDSFIRLAPGTTRTTISGVLCHNGKGSRIGQYLTERNSAELRDYRVLRSEKMWWLYAPRGLPHGFPLAGRALYNLGSRVEPILIPRNRTPTPRLSREAWRRKFGAQEGDIILWWDSQKAEHVVLATRSQTRVLSRELVLEIDW